jgi:hypothetical protein
MDGGIPIPLLALKQKRVRQYRENQKRIRVFIENGRIKATK